MKTIYTSLLIICQLSMVAYGQTTFEYANPVNLIKDGAALPLTFSGGLNAGQIQSMDVNGDGDEELVIWDINVRQVSVFKEEDGVFTHLPQLSYYFPSDVSGFLVLADYDGDGKKDLFTSSPFGIRAYRNVSPTGANFPSWELAQNFLRLDNNSNLQANNLDIPLIMDIDADGDLDIVTFNFASGDFLEFYRNTSVERKGVPDIDGFAFPEARWGGFEFCDCGQFSFGVTCSGMPMGRVMEDDNMRIEHAGGHSILYADFNGDGVMDLLMGQDECNTLYYLPNKGTNANPKFDEFSTSLPSIGVLPEFPIFHAAQLWRDQLLITTNSSSIAGPFRADYRRNFFSMPLQGGAINPFLQDQMLDLGENTRPSFQGNKLNGKLYLSANTLKDKRVVGSLRAIEVTAGDWRLTEEDYLSLSELDLTDLQYQTYRSAAGQESYWLAGTDTVNFALVKRLFHAVSEDFTVKNEVNVPGLTPRPLDHFELFAFQNRDYMLLARQTGELLLYEVSFGQGIPTLNLLERNFLGYQDNPASRNLTAHVIPGQRPGLYVADQRGQLFWIADFMNATDREEVLVRIGEELRPARLGRNTWIYRVPDAFGSSYDLLLGTTGGGLLYFRSISDMPNPEGEEFLVKVYPNPTTGPVSILANQAAEVRLVNSLGQVLVDQFMLEANREIFLQAGNLGPGLYILNFRLSNGQSHSRKLIVRP
ncbi:T9SS type A sorting domain-containing protein [Belliella buryatensis]|uniref:T9SS type A sorting domain-containing protein n=1 Tax=Belliella buryatensis TaxID=1500549 RepID=UPI001FE71C1C|nr:T9SS type A sorting domain-containing protein [Belliella buryatensis]